MQVIYDQIKDGVLDFDFRKTLWGMTRSDVKISEKDYPLSENETHITYVDSYMDLDAVVGFHFEDDSLIEAGYAFREYYNDRNTYLRKYRNIRSILTNIYGEPMVKNDICNCNEQCVECAGSCKESEINFYLVQWITTRSIIRLMLVSDETSTEFGVLYISREQDTTVHKYLI